MNKSIKKELFGKTKEGDDVTIWTLTNANGIVAKILDFGGVVYSLEVPDKEGKMENISANLATLEEYQESRPFFGALVGRYANRIKGGKFTLYGKEYNVPLNNGKNALHGGIKGFDQVIWKAEPLELAGMQGLRLTYRSVDGEEGYPGDLDVIVDYFLTNDNELIIDYTATAEAPTVINLTNHTFWNLAGATGGSILDHVVALGAVSYLPTDEGLIPTGEIASVKGTPLDFLNPKAIGKDIAGITEEQFHGGYDHCLIFPDKEPGEMSFCAYVVEPKSGRTMEILTTEPAVQFYTGNFFEGTTGVGDYKYEKHAAFCLETQHYPDSPNQPEFPSAVLEPGKVYKHTTIHRFGVVKADPLQ